MSKMFSQNLGPKFAEIFKCIFRETGFSNTVATIIQKPFNRFTPNFHDYMIHYRAVFDGACM